MNKDEKAVIEFCIDSLEREPEKWECNQYRCTHSTGVTVWHGSGPDALGVYASEWMLDSQKIGGLSTLAMLLGGGWLVPWRAHLYRAARHAWKGDEPAPVKPAAPIRSILERA